VIAACTMARLRAAATLQALTVAAQVVAAARLAWVAGLPSAAGFGLLGGLILIYSCVRLGAPPIPSMAVNKRVHGRLDWNFSLPVHPPCTPRQGRIRNFKRFTYI
jgi:hypothetical protein